MSPALLFLPTPVLAASPALVSLPFVPDKGVLLYLLGCAVAVLLALTGLGLVRVSESRRAFWLGTVLMLVGCGGYLVALVLPLVLA